MQRTISQMGAGSQHVRLSGQ